LGEIGLLVVEIVDFEEIRRPFTGVRGEDRSIDVEKSALMEEVSYRPDHLVPDPHQRHLLARAQPEMAVREQKVGAVVLLRDRVLLSGGDDLDVGSVEFKSSRGSIIRFHFPGDLDRGFVGDLSDGGETLFAKVRQAGDALHDPRPVTKLQKVELL